MLQNLRNTILIHRNRIKQRQYKKNFPMPLKPPENIMQAIKIRMAKMVQRMSKPAMNLSVVHNIRLDPKDLKHGTHNIRFCINNYSEELPEPGDMLYVQWKNRPELVEKILSIFKEDGKQKIRFLGFNSHLHPGEIISCDLRTALSEYIDIEVASIPLLQFAGFSKAAEKNLAIHRAHEKFHTYIMKQDKKPKKKGPVLHHPKMDFEMYSAISLLEGLDTLPSLTKFINWQERISGRAYTMAGASLDENRSLTIDITVSEVYKQLLDRNNQRLTSPARTSSYLLSLNKGDSCKAWVLPETYKYPVTIGRKPPKLIAIATGSGISSPLSLLRSGLQTEPMWLIYGVRSWEEKSLYGEELKEHHARGGICRLDIAESRPKSPDKVKNYVQDLLWENRQELVKEILAGAHIYLCGRLSMGHQVREILAKIFLEEHAANSIEEAQQMLGNFIETLVFQASVSGV